jgi:hypothetical protein
MRKAICAVILLVVLCGPAAGLDLAVGIKAGLSSPFYSGADYRNWLTYLEQDFLLNEGLDFDFHTKWKKGLSTGAFLTIGLSDGFALQPELLYTNAGGAYGYDETDTYYALVMNDQLRILELPLLMVVRLQRKRKDFAAFAGPAPCLRTGPVGLRISEGGATASGEYVEDQFARLFLNLVCGGSLTFYLHGGFLCSLDTRFSMGLTPVMNSGENGLELWKQNNIQILAGFGRLITGRKNLRSQVR